MAGFLLQNPWISSIERPPWKKPRFSGDQFFSIKRDLAGARKPPPDLNLSIAKQAIVQI
jgi:hypothetical protein